MLDPKCRGPVILCGDFNSAPGSAVCKKLNLCLHDVQNFFPGYKPQGTFSSRFSFHQIDHVFINDCFEIRGIRIPRTHLARVASDHLPLVVDLHLGD
jgi:endonuclease/exonuclease/phosphatase family metal-dependent hydrolase